MKIVRSFTDVPVEDSRLWTVIYHKENTDELNRLFDLWADVEYLDAFFKEHISDLKSDFWKNMPVKEAVFKAMEEAEIFEDMLSQIGHGRIWKGKTNFKQIFQPLANYEYNDKIYQKQKAKPQSRLPFLRLYAIRLADDSYIITGGAIKLTEKMNGRKHLELELAKMGKVKQHLQENGILYFEDLISK
jgi:hypothetical protein